MILPLRRAHRSVFVALALLLPVLLVCAWRVRRFAARQSIAPELLPGGEDDAADGLVYWTALEVDGETAPWMGGDDLPEDAELIGTVRSGAWGRTPPAGKVRLVYSLAHGRVAGWELIP